MLQGQFLDSTWGGRCKYAFCVPTSWIGLGCRRSLECYNEELYTDWCDFDMLYESFEQYTQSLQIGVWEKLTKLTVKRISAKKGAPEEAEQVEVVSSW